MENAIALLPAALVLLACPLMMVGMGLGAWFVARLRGQKRDLSMTCMPGHDMHQPTPEPEANAASIAKPQAVSAEHRRAPEGSL